MVKIGLIGWFGLGQGFYFQTIIRRRLIGVISLIIMVLIIDTLLVVLISNITITEKSIYFHLTPFLRCLTKPLPTIYTVPSY